MKKEERLQQQCDVCGRLLDKNISNFRKYSRKTNGLNFHTTCRDYESSTPLESQVYSSQPNERHADTWGFRGANVNMKDANGNYYIDPNRQLKGTDIQEMRTKGAKIPSGFNTLSDDEIAKLHNTFASNANNKRSNTMLIAKRGVQIKRRIIK
jgi:hypothetical protein